jgi:hypothetical protein
MNYTVYKWLKFFRFILPLVAIVHWTLAETFDWSYTYEVLVADMFILFGLGFVLDFMSKAEYGGEIEIKEQDHGIKMFSLNLNKAPEDLEKNTWITFKVK